MAGGAEPELPLQNSTLTIEEFHAKLQEATNFPLRPFVIPFLKVGPLALPAKGDLGRVPLGLGLHCPCPPQDMRVATPHARLFARVESHEAGAVRNYSRGSAQLETICEIPHFFFFLICLLISC